MASSSLARLSALTARAADSKSPSSADRDVLLVADADDGRGELGAVAHGGTLGVRARVHADVESGGTALVSADRLHAMVKTLGDGIVVLSTDAHGYLTMVRGNRRMTLPGSDPDTYPSLAQTPGEWHSLPIGALSMGLREVHYAGAMDPYERNLRPHLAGVRVESASGRLDCVACDGKRAALRSVPYVGPSLAVTMPFRLVEAVRKGLFGKVPKDEPTETEIHEAGAEAIEIAETANSIWLRRAGDSLLCAISPKLSGDYPAWRPVTDAVALCPHAAVFPRDELLEAVSAVVSLERDEYARVPVTLTWSAEGVSLSAARGAGASASDVVSAQSMTPGDGPDGCAIDGGYLRGALASFSSDTVTVRYGGPSTLVCVEPIQLGVRALAVIMPILDGS